MKGAGEYFHPFRCCYKELGLEKLSGDSYYINNILFVFGEHARGKELYIYVLKDVDEYLSKGINSCEHLKVYDAVSGNPGWTETYGFILEGKWVQICKDLMERSLTLYEEYKVRVEESKKRNEEEKNKALLEKAKLFESFI